MRQGGKELKGKPERDATQDALEWSKDIKRREHSTKQQILEIK
jgi:hypothetical protein